jgi:hypothetical protein
LLFIDLPQVIANFALLGEQPGSVNVGFGSVQIPLAEIVPAERISSQLGNVEGCTSANLFFSSFCGFSFSGLVGSACDSDRAWCQR